MEGNMGGKGFQLAVCFLEMKGRNGWGRDVLGAVFFGVWLFVAGLAEAGPVQYHLIDLTPPGPNYAAASGISSGGQVVGVNYAGAALWNGPSNMVNLGASAAFGTDGIQQVGTDLNSTNHAVLWTGTAASRIDLNPPGWFSSIGLSVANGQQVGYGHRT